MASSHFARQDGLNQRAQAAKYDFWVLLIYFRFAMTLVATQPGKMAMDQTSGERDLPSVKCRWLGRARLWLWRSHPSFVIKVTASRRSGCVSRVPEDSGDTSAVFIKSSLMREVWKGWDLFRALAQRRSLYNPELDEVQHKLRSSIEVQDALLLDVGLLDLAEASQVRQQALGPSKCCSEVVNTLAACSLMSVCPRVAAFKAAPRVACLQILASCLSVLHENEVFLSVCHLDFLRYIVRT